MSSSDPSADPPSIFDTDDHDPDAYSSASSRTSNGFDLMPPPPNVTLTNAEALSIRLFSTDHLNLIIHNQPFFSHFIAFLNEYRPDYAPTLIRYLETLKAAAAVDYANAIARRIVGPEKTSSATLVAATLSSKFGSGSRRVAEQLVNEALPAYITFRLTNVVTELLINEIMGCSAAGSRNLVCGLAEAYCLTDPSRPGNPIVYASEGFHTTTLYGRDFVIGRNCRFLQGPKSSRATIARISAAIRNGQEQSELLLNYRRDGSPFLNLCLVAPLHDNRGNVRYFIGCQIDVTNLVERCQGLDSFQMLLEKDQQMHQHEASGQQQEKDALEALGRLGELLSLEEMEMIRSKGRPGSDSRSITPARGNHPLASNSQLRRYVSAEDSSDGGTPRPRAANRLNPSGRFPNAYETFILVRPYPSLRITFTSPALRIPGLLQSRLLDRIGGPHSVKEIIRTSLADGARITAKVNWLTNSGHRKTPSTDRAGRPFVDIHGRAPPHYASGKTRWIHCTPLYGADGNVGVWMVVMVDPDENETQYASYSTGHQQNVSHRDRRQQSVYPARSDSAIRANYATAGPSFSRKAPSPAPSRPLPQRVAPNYNDTETLPAMRFGDSKRDPYPQVSHSQPPSPPPGFQAPRGTPLQVNTSHAAFKNAYYGAASANPPSSSAAARAILDQNYYHQYGQHYHDSQQNSSGIRRSRSLNNSVGVHMGTAITTNSPVPAPSYYPPPAGYPAKPPTPTIDDFATAAIPPSRTGTPAFNLTDQNRPTFTPTPTLTASNSNSPVPGRAEWRDDQSGTDRDNASEPPSGTLTPLVGGAAGAPAVMPQRGYDDNGRIGRSAKPPSRAGSVTPSSTTLRAGRLTPVAVGSASVRAPSAGRSLAHGGKDRGRDRERERRRNRDQSERDEDREHEARWERDYELERSQSQHQQPATTTTNAVPTASVMRPRAATHADRVVPKKVEWVEGLHRQASIGSSIGGRSTSPTASDSPITQPATATAVPLRAHSPTLTRENSKRGGLTGILTSSKSSLKGSKDKAKEKGVVDTAGGREISNISRERSTPTAAEQQRSGSAGSGGTVGKEPPLTALPPPPPLPPPLAPPRERSPRLALELEELGTWGDELDEEGVFRF